MANKNLGEQLDVSVNTNGAYGSSADRQEMLERSGAIIGGPGMIRHATGAADGAAPPLDWRKVR